MRRLGWSVLSVLLFLVVAAEAAVRWFGFTDFPVYDADNQIGYIIKSDQHGKFMNVNDWYFNNKSMPVQREYDDTLRPDVLLIGNSIIMGGNPYKQKQKLTPLIQEQLGDRPVVWPIAIGGWTDINEMVYLDRHPEVVAKADYLAWEYMSGGLSSATPWISEYVFPTHKPTFAAWYFLRRDVAPILLPLIRGSELPVVGPPDPAHIEAFDSHVGAITHAIDRPNPGFIWLYPTLAELKMARSEREWLPERAQITQIAEKHGLRIVDIANYKEWDERSYRGDGIHPNVEGNVVLANILADEIKKDMH
jgi:hypothetical protein